MKGKHWGVASGLKIMAFRPLKNKLLSFVYGSQILYFPRLSVIEVIATCGISDNWEPQIMATIVTWQWRVTLDTVQWTVPLRRKVLLAPTGALVEMMVYYTSTYISAAATFSDFHSVHWCNWCYKCHSKSLKQYQCNWCHKMLIECWMFKCSNYPFQCSNYPFQCFNVPVFQCSNVLMFHWSIGQLVH